MKKLSMLFIGGCLFATGLWAEMPDYSGVYTLDKSKTINLSQGKKGRGKAMEKVIIHHEGSQFVTERITSSAMRGEQVLKESLTLDGQVCRSETEIGPRSTTAVWSEEQQAVLIESSMDLKMRGQAYTLKFSEIWQFESDGALKISIKRTSPRGERESVQIYQKEK